MERVPKRDHQSASAPLGAKEKLTSQSGEGEVAKRFDRSPLMTAQRTKLQSLFGAAIQRQEGEEEPLQGKFDAMRRAGEYAPLQGKFPLGAAMQPTAAPAAKPNNTGLPAGLGQGKGAPRMAVGPGHVGPGNVTQRYLDIQGGGVFKAGDVAALCNRYSKQELLEMLAAIQEEGGNRERYPTVKAALESPDVIMIGGSEGEYYAEFIEQPRKPVKGGAERYVLGHASYAPRPSEGFEDLHLSGLMNCVAVAVETRNHLGVSGIALAHFTTPLDIDAASKKLTEHGHLVLNGFGMLVPGGFAQLRWNQGSPEERDDDDYVSGQTAANIVAFALHARGIVTESIEPLEGGTCRYRLNHDGTAAWV